MNAQDEAFLIQFSDQAQVVQEFTGSMKEIEDRMRSLKPGGLTALLDAVELGVREMKKAKNPRKALVVVSDGGDNHSRYTADRYQGRRERSGHADLRDGSFRAQFFPQMSAEIVSGPRLLAQIADQTGRPRIRRFRVQPASRNRREDRHRVAQPVRAGVFTDE